MQKSVNEYDSTFGGVRDLWPFLLGGISAVALLVVITAANTLVGFRNDYLQLRAEHKQMLQFLSEPAAQVGTNTYSKADILNAIVKQAVTKEPDK